MTVRLTPRDMLAMTVLAEHYGAPTDLIAEMLGVSIWRAYELVRRWRETGMASSLDVRPVPGPRWIFPTRSAAEILLGFPVQPWKPTPKMANHVTTVLRVRLALVGMDLDRWVSERRLRSESGAVERGQAREHIHDGRYLNEDDQLVAVEVELSKKSPRNALVAMQAAYRAAELAECEKLTYYCGDDDVRKSVIDTAEKVMGLMRRSKVGTQLSVASVDKLLANPPAKPRPGLRLIDGGASEQAAL